ncbi:MULTISPECIES: hypothetical protein [Pseudoalteromonas]|uniref:hypothetical protein n=1 Tax=Pseudoalteromonas TaxID=53246 RepID=UPI001EF58261|nr:hypothetical protein [Pseudoalteromonas sp. Of11M-6]MCG7556052.1 hypothetical protein [Pseudoalteromonas sp. Of11M-6]
MKSNVSVITQSVKQSDGQFTQFIHSVWTEGNGMTAKENARKELKRLKAAYQKDDEHLTNWRAVTPIGQIDDLSIQHLAEGSNWWDCRTFYKIVDKELNKPN